MNNKVIKKQKLGTLFRVICSTVGWEEEPNNVVPGSTKFIHVKEDQFALLVKKQKYHERDIFLVKEGVLVIPSRSLELA
jgi:hypothetical protein